MLEKRLALEDTNTHVVVTSRDDRRYVLLRRASDGRYLSSTSSASSELGGETGADGSTLLRCVDLVDDSAVWSYVVDGFQQAVSGAIIAVEAINAGQDGGPASVNLQLPDAVGDSLASVEFSLEYGPESLPSEYLETLQQHGIVCMPSLLAPTLVEELQELAAAQVAAEDAGAESSQPLALRSVAAARCCTNPVVLFVIRSYMRTDDVMQAHYPGFAVLRPNDGTGIEGADGPGGWHSDWPYSPGVLHTYLESMGNYPTELPLGLQVNWCITDFTPQNGGTCFVPGSRDLQRPPPPEWGRRTGLSTYAGPEATQFIAPAGTVIIYDSRTWHRSGMNRTVANRVAVLNAITPKWVVAMDDTRNLYQQLLERRSLLSELTERERQHVADFMSGSFSRESGRQMMREAVRGLRGARSKL